MSMQPANRQEFEEGLREDGIHQQQMEKLGGLIDSTEKKMNALINTSADDCAISLNNDAERDPAGTIRRVLAVLHLMNLRGIERKSHRHAMLRAGRKALNKIGEFR